MSEELRELYDTRAQTRRSACVVVMPKSKAVPKAAPKAAVPKAVAVPAAATLPQPPTCLVPYYSSEGGSSPIKSDNVSVARVTGSRESRPKRSS